MSLSEICEIMETQIKIHFPDSQIISLTVADGGEGSVDSFLAAVGGEKSIYSHKSPLLTGCGRFLRDFG